MAACGTRTWGRTALLLAMLLLALTPISRAQAPVNVRVNEVTYIETSARVQARITVSDANGSAICGLSRDNVQVYEDGKLVSEGVEIGETVGDGQVHIALALDVSGSMGGQPLADLKRAADGFFQSLAEQDKAAVIAFSNEVDLGEPFPRIDTNKEADFTHDKGALRNLTSGLTTKPGNTTPLYDALLKAVKMASRQPRQNRAILLMSDGKDEGLNPGDPGSKIAKPDDPINLAREAGIPIYTIGLGKPEHLDEGYLQRAALLTGGFYTRLQQSEDLPTAFQEVLKRLKTEYVISFKSPAGPDGEKHQVLVRVTLPAIGSGQSDAYYEAPLPAKPLIKRMYYWEGSNKRDLKEGQELRGRSIRFTPEILCQKPIARVEYYLDDTKTPMVVREPPFEFVWNTGAYKSGPHTLTVVAYDTADPTNVGTMDFRIGLARAPWEEQVAGLPIWAIALVLILLVAGLLTLLFPKKRRCPNCGRIMDKGWDYCLFCAREAAQASATVGAGSGEERPTGRSLPAGFMSQGEPETREMGAGVSVVPPRDKTVVLHAAPENLAYLIVQSGTHVGRQFRLEPETSIGRAETNTVVLDDPAVGRQQCKIKLEQGEFYIYDLACTNPTVVNGQKVLKYKLADGDRIQIGNTVLVFKVV